MNSLRARLKAALVHLVASAAVATLAAGLVFGLWYPGDFRRFAGGQGLFLLLVSVDVVMGPLLTAVAWNPTKGRAHLRRDLITIVALQLAALAYGLHTVYVARPVALVYEADRFRSISAQEVEQAELPSAAEPYRQLPLGGPWYLGTRTPKAGDERNDALFKAIEGADLAQRPLFWQPYDASRSTALGKSRSIAVLLAKNPAAAAAIREHLAELGLAEAEARFVPLAARGDWVVVLDAQGRIRGYMPYDGFF